MKSDDFSFPKIPNPLPHFAISPSLWRVSSVVYPDYPDEKEVDFARNSFSCLQNDQVKTESSEEIMDMLWEDFNEELQRVSSLDKKKQSDESSNNDISESGTEMKRVCCVQDLSISKPGNTNRIICQSKRQSNKAVLLKVLKKIFLLHNSSVSAQIKRN